MKDLLVQRTVLDGWTSQSLQMRNQTTFSDAARKAARRKTMQVALAGVVPLLWLLPGVRHAASTTPAFAIPFFLLSVAAGLYSLTGLSKVAEHRRRIAEPLHLPGARSNDPHSATGALDALVAELRTVPRNQRRLDRSYADAVERLQKIVPDDPLHTLVRRGYYPSRPTVYENGQPTYLNCDDAKDHVHWDRMSVALDNLRAMLRSENLLTQSQVRRAVSQLVPPLRAVLRTHGVATHRIEYLPPKPQIVADGEASAALPAPPSDVEPEPMPEDAFTPVEDRLNASATMTVSAIRTLELSLQAAEEYLFMGDDLGTARRLMTQHVPSLVRSYIVAHDTTQGEERDQVRAEFAQGLSIVRDTLSGIMRRHAQEARRRMEDETRFLRMRHGEGPSDLSPSGDATAS